MIPFTPNDPRFELVADRLHDDWFCGSSLWQSRRFHICVVLVLFSRVLFKVTAVEYP